MGYHFMGKHCKYIWPVGQWIDCIDVVANNVQTENWGNNAMATSQSIKQKWNRKWSNSKMESESQIKAYCQIKKGIVKNKMGIIARATSQSIQQSVEGVK